jgi:hypothetical protein
MFSHFDGFGPKRVVSLVGILRPRSFPGGTRERPPLASFSLIPPLASFLGPTFRNHFDPQPTTRTIGGRKQGAGVSLVPPGNGRERRTIGGRGNQDVRLFASKRSIKRVSIATTRASISFPGRTRSIETKPLATDESEFNAIDIEFFVVKKGIHRKNKTNY